MQSIGHPLRIAQNRRMDENKPAGVRVRRPAGGRAAVETSGAAESEADELELVSTQMLKQILSSRDFENRKGVADAARHDGEGVLARDPQTGYFVILDEEELRAIVDSGQALPKLSRPSDVTAEPLHDYADDEHLSLVSIQALRRVIDDATDVECEAMKDTQEFDPYRSQ